MPCRPDEHTYLSPNENLSHLIRSEVGWAHILQNGIVVLDKL